MKRYHQIEVIPGGGIGEETVSEGVKWLEDAFRDPWENPARIPILSVGERLLSATRMDNA